MNNTLYERVLLVLKHKNQHFSDDIKQITGNVNLVFNTNYTEDEVNVVIGKIYEEQFNYGVPETA
jgi:hypothetical protein